MTVHRRRAHTTASPVGYVSSWEDEAACAGMFPMFDDYLHGESAAQRESRHHRALNVCRGCPVTSECLAMALEHHFEGVWGGRLMGSRKTGPLALRAPVEPLTAEQLRERRNARESKPVQCSCGAVVKAANMRRHQVRMHGEAS